MGGVQCVFLNLRIKYSSKAKGKPTKKLNITLKSFSSEFNLLPFFLISDRISAVFLICPFRATNGVRTRDPNLGKVVLYQLSYCRNLIITTNLDIILQYNKIK